jgi:hypothetical protein
MNLNHILKKVGRGNLFSNLHFLILHALGYLKPVTVFLYIKFVLTSPSACCYYFEYIWLVALLFEHITDDYDLHGDSLTLKLDRMAADKKWWTTLE